METRKLALGECRSSSGSGFKYSVDPPLKGFNLFSTGTRVCGRNKLQSDDRLDAEYDRENVGQTSGFEFRRV
jgi:hypothetical protein